MDGFGAKECIVIVVGGILCFGTIAGLGPFVGCILSMFGWRMLEFVEGMGDVIRHGDVGGALLVIPC
jgi:hypothetical protein